MRGKEGRLGTSGRSHSCNNFSASCYSQLPTNAGLLASGSSYSPRLPILIGQWLDCGFRPQLQQRVCVGLSPTSLRNKGSIFVLGTHLLTYYLIICCAILARFNLRRQVRGFFGVFFLMGLRNLPLLTLWPLWAFQILHK